MKFHTAAPDGFYCLLRAKTLGIRADTELTRKLIKITLDQLNLAANLHVFSLRICRLRIKTFTPKGALILLTINDSLVTPPKNFRNITGCPPRRSIY